MNTSDQLSAHIWNKTDLGNWICYFIKYRSNDRVCFWRKEAHKEINEPTNQKYTIKFKIEMIFWNKIEIVMICFFKKYSG